MIRQERLKELLDYNPDTGEFRWRVIQGNRKGKAGSLHKSGYIHIQIDRKILKAHRLAWLYQYGQLPDLEVDHIDGVKSNNTIKNLRLATKSENQRNSKIRSDNTSKVKGINVKRNKNITYWRANLRYHGKVKSKHFPYTDEGKAQAIKWIEETRKLLHGDFARHN